MSWLLQILPSRDHAEEDVLMVVGNCKCGMSLSGSMEFLQIPVKKEKADEFIERIPSGPEENSWVEEIRLPPSHKRATQQGAAQEAGTLPGHYCAQRKPFSLCCGAWGSHQETLPCWRQRMQPCSPLG